MAMISISLSKYNLTSEYENIDRIKEKLMNYSYVKNHEELELKSAVNLNMTTERIGSDIKILSGIIFDEYIRHNSRIILNKDSIDYQDRYSTDNSPYLDVRMGNFWILNNGLIISNSKVNRNFISSTLKSALGTDVKPISFDIGAIASDYHNNWLGGIVDREGNWQAGTLYGNDLRNDDCIGGAFVSCQKKQVGGYTDHFGNGPVKFRVTKDGVLTLFLAMNNGILPLIKFVNEEMESYFRVPNFT